MTKNDLVRLLREQLRDLVLERMSSPGLAQTPVEGLTTYRQDDTVSHSNCFYEPLVTLPLQGNKRSVIGSDEFRYGENQCLVACVDVPTMNYVTAATPEKPYLAITLALDKHLVGRLLAEMPETANCERCPSRATEIIDADPNLMGAFLRLAEICDDEKQIPMLAPLIIREIHYRLLIGPVGHILRTINTSGTVCNQISSAIAWLRDNFKEPLQVEKLAERFNMSPPHFYRRFKQITTLSPVQFQKRLRLHEAQRLMLTEDTDAYHAALAVGYESPTQFNREYKRLFGEPPRRDVQRMANSF